MQSAKLKIASVITIGLVVVTAHLAQAFCFDKAADRYNIPPQILWWIAQRESSMKPTVVHYNTNGTYDYGLMGINTIHEPDLRRIGIKWETLSDPCTNVMVGAWLLNQRIQEYGYNWKAVGAYHSKTPSKRDDYANKIAEIAKKYPYVAPVSKEEAPKTSTNLVTLIWGGTDANSTAQ